MRVDVLFGRVDVVLLLDGGAGLATEGGGGGKVDVTFALLTTPGVKHLPSRGQGR